MKKILIIDDDLDICFLLEQLLKQNGYETASANSPKKGLAVLEKSAFDLVITDYRMEGMDGNELMYRIKERQNIPVIIITGFKDVKTAVDSIRGGAFDYILKPLLPEELLMVTKAALESPPSSTQRVLSTAKPASGKPAEKIPTDRFSNKDYIVGKSAAFNEIMQQIILVAPTDYTVIINGESGTGKEAIAQEIHNRSNRSHEPFVAIDCGALSKELAGSELFGHEKGSFTGAMNQKTGSLEMANRGTIFLDEVANLSYNVQVSLLRVLQERKIRPVGGLRDIDIDVRIIVASNEKLWSKCRTGNFREDLYHRFNEFSIEVPPLRNRKEDIPLLAKHFLDLSNKQLEKQIEGFSPECIQAFTAYYWPGNLRELKNTVKRSALMTEGNMVELSAIPPEIINPGLMISDARMDTEPLVSFSIEAENAKAKFTSLKISAIDYEYEMIQRTLKENNFNKSKTAKLLNIDRKTLYNKIAIYRELVLKNAAQDEPATNT